MAEVKPRNLLWIGDDALLVRAAAAANPILAPGREEATVPYGIDLSGDAIVTRLLQERRDPTLRVDGGGRGRGFGFQAGAELVGQEHDTGRVFYARTDNESRRTLYAIDPKNDRHLAIDQGSRTTFNWAVDARGRPIFRIDSMPALGRYTLLTRSRNSWEVLLDETAVMPQLSLYGPDAEDNIIVGMRPQGSDTFGLYALSSETGNVGAAVLAPDDLDVAAARIDPYTNRVIGASITDTPPTWFDSEMAEHQALLDEAFPGEFPSIVSWSSDRGRMIVTTESEDRTPAVYLYDTRAPSVDQIGSAFTALQGAVLGARRPYSYQARDGTRIPAYLTRPAGANEASPLVVLPHSGPASRDVAGYGWLAHFLAARGYTVLQPNFRGSRGFGTAWEAAGRGEWGIGLMQHDLSDGIAALVDADIADPDRVCIVGVSYGGYAALAGAAFTPDLYRCSAAIAGISNLVELLGVEDDRPGRPNQGAPDPTVNYWRQAMGGGDPASSNGRLSAASPIEHVAQVRAPILLLHSRSDSLVPLTQSQEMAQALRGAGKDVELIELEGDDHWLSGEASRLATLQALERFLGEHL
jgi:dipeptidyl aminopeptidase/acylaminoacyl peptidase